MLRGSATRDEKWDRITRAIEHAVTEHRAMPVARNVDSELRFFDRVDPAGLT
jgi:hypothetical protein